jgi:hypothetical protein
MHVRSETGMPPPSMVPDCHPTVGDSQPMKATGTRISVSHVISLATAGFWRAVSTRLNQSTMRHLNALGKRDRSARAIHGLAGHGMHMSVHTASTGNRAPTTPPQAQRLVLRPPCLSSQISGPQRARDKFASARNWRRRCGDNTFCAAMVRGRVQVGRQSAKPACRSSINLKLRRRSFIGA